MSIKDKYLEFINLTVIFTEITYTKQKESDLKILKESDNVMTLLDLKKKIKKISNKTIF